MALTVGSRLGHYTVTALIGEGGHTLCHGGAVFADSVRWLMG